MLLPQRSTLVPYTTLFRSPGARQAHCLRAAGGVVDNAYCRAPRARRRGGERHREGAAPIDGQGGGAEGTVVGLVEVAGVDGRSRRVDSSHRVVAYAVFCWIMSWSGRGDLLVAKRLKTGRERRRRRCSPTRRSSDLRAAGGVVDNAYCRAPRARRRGGERHREGAAPIDGQGGGAEGTVVGLVEVAG